LKHITINVSEEIKNILPETLEKDLQDNEKICPICHGLGMRLSNSIYGIKGDASEVAKHKIFPYNHQSLSFCPNCYNGVIKLCEYCGELIPKGRLKCNCVEQKEKDEEERRIKYQEKIDKAKEISWEETEYYVYDEKSDKYFADKQEFVDYYFYPYFNDLNALAKYSFKEYLEKHAPKVLWNCSVENISINADSIIEDVCVELHENAEESISSEDRKELQTILDDWCKRQSGATTYYPDYKEYVKVDWEWVKES
jgi:hypothetical protein